MLGFSVSAVVRAVIYGDFWEEAVECLPNGWLAAWDFKPAETEFALLSCWCSQVWTLILGLFVRVVWAVCLQPGLTLVWAWTSGPWVRRALCLKWGFLQASAGVGVPGAPQSSACGWRYLTFTIRRLSALQPWCGISTISCWFFSRF